MHRHIVLAVHHESARWGALGLSREEGLQWKLLSFGCLSALLSDYREAYRGCGHEVTKVRIGLPMPHNDHYKGKVRRLRALLGCWMLSAAPATFTASGARLNISSW